MLKSSYFPLAIFILVSLFGCSKSKTSPFPSVRMELGVVSLDVDSELDSLFLDDGSSYYIREVKRAAELDTQFTRPRVLTYMREAEVGEAIIHDLVGVTTIIPEPESIDQEYKPRDPLKVFRVWAGGDFINIEYGIKSVDTSLHKVEFKDYIREEEGEDPVVEISVYHDRGGDIEGSTKKNLVSIPLDYYRARLGVPFYLQLSLPSYKGIKTYKFEVKL